MAAGMDDQNRKNTEGQLIRRTLDVGPEASASARDALNELAADLPPDALRDAQLLVSDLIRHRVSSRPLSEPSMIDLEYLPDGGTIADPGRG